MAARTSSKMVQQSLQGTSLLLSILLFMMAFAVHPSVAQNTCNRFRPSSSSNCPSRYEDYFRSYDSQVGQEYKVLDGIEAQTSYINIADEAKNDMLEKLFHPANRNDTLKEVIKSLTELNLMKDRIEKMGDLGHNHSDVVVALFSHAAYDACQYLKTRFDEGSIPLGNCTDNSLLEQLYNRLNFIEALTEAKTIIRNSIKEDNNSRVTDYCAWMNDRALENCVEPSTRNTPLYSSLNTVCNSDRFVKRTLCPIN